MSTSTEKPRIYGHYEGHLIPEDMTVWSVGETPEDAVEAFCRARLAVDDPKLEIIGTLSGGDPRYAWGLRFWACETSFKAAGIYVPGGAILTWWK